MLKSSRSLTALVSGLFTLAVLQTASAVQVLYAFDSDTTAAATDWLTGDGAQNAVVLGSPGLSPTAAFGAQAGLFPAGAYASLELPDTTALGSSFTLAAMVNESIGDFSRVFSSFDGGAPAANELVFDINPSRNSTGFGLRAFVNGTSVTRSVAFNDASYHHVAMTYDAGSVRLFLDGRQLGEPTSVGSGSINLARNLRFGEDYAPTSLTNEPFVGLADDLLVYNRALSPNEIGSLFQHGAVTTLLGPPLPEPVIDIASRIQMMVDDRMIGASQGVTLTMQAPQPREVVMRLNQGFETNASTYFTALRDDQGQVRLYYRGNVSGQEATLMAVSNDGVNFSRPSIGAYEINSSGDNNVVLMGSRAHNLAPFLDTNPSANPDAKWKAVGGQGSNGLYALQSSDGIHWELAQPTPLSVPGLLDSQNLAFWDNEAGLYRLYSRYYDGGLRAVQMSTSPDFVNWTGPVSLQYDVPLEQFYTNAIVQLPETEPAFVGFPMRFDPTRTNLPSPGQTGVTDAVFISSHDGVHFDRTFAEPWIEEGYDSTRSHMTAWGIIETSDTEWSLYSTEHYLLPTNQLRRYTVRPYGFGAIHADSTGGWFETPVVEFEGADLVLNFATGDVGEIAIEVRDADGFAIPGFTLEDSPRLNGDSLTRHVVWKSGRSLGELLGQNVKIYFEMKDANLFALSFGSLTLTGDYNGDREIDAADYNVWQNQYGLTGVHAADGNGDGAVDAADYNVWRDALGPAEASQSVPEPLAASSMVIALLAMAGARIDSDHLAASSATGAIYSP